jgi:hypothetical protein
MASLAQPHGNLARASLPVCLACLIGLACNAVTPVPTPESRPESRATSPAPAASPLLTMATLATPYADSPAAGICASFESPVVEIRIEPGIPDPRCALVRADQQLKVTNDTDSPLDVSIGAFSGHMEPGGEFAIEAPFGSYLAPGVHQLQVLPCCGPEIFLQQPPP